MAKFWRTVIALAEMALCSLTARGGKRLLPATFRDEAASRWTPAARVWESTPVYFVQKGLPLFLQRRGDGAERRTARPARWANWRWLTRRSCSGISEAEVMAEMLRRYDIMVRSVERGLDADFTGLQLLPACAGAIFKAEAAGRLSVRSLHTRAAARALAVMHVDGAMGVVLRRADRRLRRGHSRQCW